MQQRSSRRFQLVLMLLTLISALIMGYLVVWLASGGQSAEIARRRAVLGAEADSVTETAQAQLALAVSPTTRASSTPGPTPTFVPITPSSLSATDTPSPEPPPSEPPTPELPTSTVAPPPVAAAPPRVMPTRAPAPAPTRPPAPAPIAPDPVVVNGPAVRLDDTAWQGGYRQGRGYGGRSATWVYGQATDYPAMQSVIVLDTPPRGTATLTIEGMDSEDRAKTPIRITVNGSQIFNGPNPLPNDDLPLATGTWASHNFRFDAAVLKPGRNVVRISNLASGTFGLPPFFMLDYAVLSLPVAEQPAPPVAAPPAPATDVSPPPPAATEIPTPTPGEPAPAPTSEPTSEPTAPTP